MSEKDRIIAGLTLWLNDLPTCAPSGPAIGAKYIPYQSGMGLGRFNRARYTVPAPFAAHLTVEGC